MDVIFMGTPEFAVPALQDLVDSTKYNVVAVFSQKPKLQGRGMKLKKSSVHTLADEYDIPVYTHKIKSEEGKKIINTINADIIIVVAYGSIIPIEVVQSKKYGCINLHPSKLPKYRGAAPLQRTIINGEKETAVCVMQMDRGLDTGDIILQKNIALQSRITLKELHDKCADIGAEMLIEVLDKIDSLPRVKQKSDCVVYANKLTKEEGKIDWNYSAFKIDCMVRGMNPWPGVYFEFNNHNIKILQANYSLLEHGEKVGKVLNQFFDVACGEGVLHIQSVQLEGKKPITATDYINGNRQKLVGQVLS